MQEPQTDLSLFAELYDVHPQGILWLSPIFSEDQTTPVDFEYRYSNEEGLRFLNLSREQFSGLRISTSPTLSPEVRKTVMEEVSMVYNSGEKSETRFFNPALNKYGKVLRTRLRNGVLTVIEDLTKENRIIHQLKQQAEQLSGQKALLDNILQNSSNGISVSKVFRDESGTVVDALTILANDAAVNFIGLPKDIYLSKRATEIEPQVMTSPYYQACIKTLDTGEPFVMQYRMHSTNRWLELSVSRLDSNHLIQIFTDVTAIKEAHLQLESVANTLKTVFDAAQTGMFTFLPQFNEAGEIYDFRFGMVNATVAGYAGRKPEELEGELGTKWFPGYLTNGELDLYRRCFFTGEPQRKEIFYHLEGKDFFLDLQCVKVEEQLLVTLTDHSTLRRSQRQLEETVKALEQSNTNLEDFAHAASHDMKEPLRKIRTFTSRLLTTLDSKLTESERGLFNRIEVAAERMQILVDDLLEFSHVSEQPQELEEVDLNEKLRKVLADLELPIEEKGARIVIEPMPTIRGNRRQLQQLFQNLIGNALKYSRAGEPPVITIRATKLKGKDVRIDLSPDLHENWFYLMEVKDNGIGFEQQYAERIFKMFQRLHGRSEYSGTGVGLSIARKVVENHNGFIWAESEVNQGASFFILFPV